MKKKKPKGIGLLSGGLDSLLAVKVLQEQDIDLTIITYMTPFFAPDPKYDPALVLGIPVRVLDIGEEHLQMVRKPVYGYGSQMNPCIDCHALMLREAGRIMAQEDADFLFTGEVLGQRPMSQRRDSLRSVENLAGCPGRVLRPLSAKLLSPTTAELEGLVDRERLLDIQGRSRKRQMALASHYGITHFPQPGGACMLTKEGFSRKLKALLHYYPTATVREVELLKCGRQFLLPEGSICSVGRNQADNEKLLSLLNSDDYALNVLDHPSPTAVLFGNSITVADLRLAAMMLTAYSDAPRSIPVNVQWRHGGSCGVLTETKPERTQFENYQI